MFMLLFNVAISNLPNEWWKVFMRNDFYGFTLHAFEPSLMHFIVVVLVFCFGESGMGLEFHSVLVESANG